MLTFEELQQQFGIAGASTEIKELIAVIEQVAPTDVTVLVTGESGTGKEVFANLIHHLSRRRDKPFIAVNCGAIPQGILESELFGHEKGSFTGAGELRKGYFESADGGTIFLDEIGEMPIETQVKFLRVLETGQFTRVGASQARTTDVRIIAATNRELLGEVRRKNFREDLYFRLRAVQLQLPPLRNRREDILPIAAKFIRDLEKKHGMAFQGFTDEASQLLLNYDWPGNVRELRNLIETMLIIERNGKISVETLTKYLYRDRQVSENLPVPTFKSPEQAERELIYRALVQLQGEVTDMKKMLVQLLKQDLNQDHVVPNTTKLLPPPAKLSFDSADFIEQGKSDFMEQGKSLKDLLESFYNEASQRAGVVPSLADLEKFAIQKTLQRFSGSRRQAAKVLGITERTLYRKLKEYNLEK
jgi:DNA-binding NtrC family response regulator